MACEGEFTPKVGGLVDWATEDKKLDVKTAGTADSLLFNTGRMERREDAGEDGSKYKMKTNEMIVYDEA